MSSPSGSTAAAQPIGESSFTAWYSKLSPSIPRRTNPSSDVPCHPRSSAKPTTTCSGHLSEVNIHLTQFDDLSLSRGNLRELRQGLIQGQNGALRRARQDS